MLRSPAHAAIESHEFADPIRLALISDTHVYPHGARRLSRHVLSLFRQSGASVIVHAGDVSCQAVIDELAEVAPVLAVQGNNDDGAFGDALPDRLDIMVGKRLLRVLHGQGGRSARAVAAEASTGCDVIVYGHSHIPMIERVGEAILINPGSPTDRRWHPHFGVGFLTIASGKIAPELVLFTDPRDLDRVELPPIKK